MGVPSSATEIRHGHSFFFSLLYQVTSLLLCYWLKVLLGRKIRQTCYTWGFRQKYVICTANKSLVSLFFKQISSQKSWRWQCCLKFNLKQKHRFLILGIIDLKSIDHKDFLWNNYPTSLALNYWTKWTTKKVLQTPYFCRGCLKTHLCAKSM